MRKLVLIIWATILLIACKKRPDPVVATSEPAQLKIDFKHVVDGEPLILNTGNYVNANGDSFTVDAYTYYISNIKLISNEGKEFSENESYHLISEKKPDSKSFIIKELPEGQYNKISFLIGVDSVRNVSGAQTGALAPENEMFWSWNTGYIMAKIEGTSPKAQYGYAFHLGGFSGKQNVVRKVTQDLPVDLIIEKGSRRELHITSNVAEWFKAPHLIDLSKFSFVATPGEDAMTIADNYSDMFTVDSIE